MSAHSRPKRPVSGVVVPEAARWHGRLAARVIALLARLLASSLRRLAALVSASRDGGLLARVLELFDVVGIRGSSSRRGAPALRELVSAASRGCDLAVTPDGPRGPRYEPQAGVISLAQITQLPIVPVSFRLCWKRTLRSWDRFQIPIPFSRCEVVFGEPIWVPRQTDEAGREQSRLLLKERLMAMTHD